MIHHNHIIDNSHLTIDNSHSIINHHKINDLSYDDRFRAILANLSYSAPSKISEVISSKRIIDSINQAKIDHSEYASKLSNLKILNSNYDSIILKDDISNTCYLSVRGTDLSMDQSTLSRDLINDILIAKGYNPHRILKTDNLLQHEISLNPSCKWEAVGHSLGGRIVEEIGIKYPELKVTSFEAGYGLGDIKHILDKYDNITSHKIVGDIMTLGISPGETIYHKIDNELNPLNYHSLKNYY